MFRRLLTKFRGQEPPKKRTHDLFCDCRKCINSITRHKKFVKGIKKNGR